MLTDPVPPLLQQIDHAVAPHQVQRAHHDEVVVAIVEENVEDAADNTTRFVVLARQPLDPVALAGERAMTTFVFEVKNIPAALYKALGGFATNGVNMTKLESYQKGASFAATTFFADIVGAPGDAAVDRALEELAFHCKELRMLGTYRQARQRG